MKRILLLSVASVVLIIGLTLVGCKKAAGTFGQPLNPDKSMTVGELYTQADALKGKSVTLEGQITQECPTGGWFFLKDKTGSVFVNLHPSDFAIPQAVGQKVVAQGVVHKEGPSVEVVGSGVELK